VVVQKYGNSKKLILYHNSRLEGYFLKNWSEAFGVVILVKQRRRGAKYDILI
jgi:hypothetical protein